MVLGGNEVLQLLTASFEGLAAGTYDLTVSNGTGCSDTLAGALVVLPRPIIFFIDPPVVYNGIPLQSTLYVANVNGGGINSVEVRRVGTASWTEVTHDYNPAKPNQVLATIPANLVGANESFSYEIGLSDAAGCESTLNGIATLTRVVSLAPFQVIPPFGGSSEESSFMLTIPDPALGQPLAEVPRIYLNPTSGQGYAAAVKAIGFNSSTEVTAQVPAGLAPGTYDVIVVNPNGSTGILKGGYLVTVTPPPVIDSISPGAVPGTGTTVKLYGKNFGTGKVELRCRAYANPAAQPVVYPVSGIVVQSYGLDFTVPAGIGQDTVCVVRAVSPTDGSYDEYSALVVLNPAENIPGNVLGSSTMKTARRAPVALVGAVSRTARFLYLLGGDSGNTNQALSSVEVVPLSPYGDLGTFRTLTAALPAGRTFAAGAVVGRFLFLVGGVSGATTYSSGVRAEVLRPQDSPVIDGALDVALGAQGLGPGLWYYRVSAVMADNDPDNAGGETLPSEALPVTVPPWAPGKFVLTMRWSKVDGAKSYVVYRTPTANEPVSAVKRIATVPAAQLQITDALMPAQAESPKRLGDLGSFMPLPAMNTARSQFGLAVARDPNAQVSQLYLYAIAGADSAGNPLATGEFLTLTNLADGSLSPAATWTSLAANVLSGTKRLHGVYSVDSTASTLLGATETWVYVGPGLGTGAGTTRVLSAKVQTGGTLTTWANAAQANTNRAGYGAAAASNQIFLFGGSASATPSDSRDSGRMDSPGTLNNVNSTGSSMVVARALMGCTIGSGRMFMAGGDTNAGVSNSVESTVW